LRGISLSSSGGSFATALNKRDAKTQRFLRVAPLAAGSCRIAEGTGEQSGRERAGPRRRNGSTPAVHRRPQASEERAEALLSIARWPDPSAQDAAPPQPDEPPTSARTGGRAKPNARSESPEILGRERERTTIAWSERPLVGRRTTSSKDFSAPAMMIYSCMGGEGESIAYGAREPADGWGGDDASGSMQRATAERSASTQAASRGGEGLAPQGSPRAAHRGRLGSALALCRLSCRAARLGCPNGPVGSTPAFPTSSACHTGPCKNRCSNPLGPATIETPMRRDMEGVRIVQPMHAVRQ